MTTNKLNPACCYNTIMYCNNASLCMPFRLVFKNLLWELILRDFIWKTAIKSALKSAMLYLVATPLIYLPYDFLYKFILCNLFYAVQAMTRPITSWQNFTTKYSGKDFFYFIASNFLALGTSLFALGLPSLSSPSVFLQWGYLSTVFNTLDLEAIRFLTGIIFCFVPGQEGNALFAETHLRNTFGEFFANFASTARYVFLGLMAGLPFFAVGVEDLKKLSLTAGYFLGFINLTIFTITRAMSLKEVLGGYLDGKFSQTNKRQELNWLLKNLTKEEKQLLQDQLKEQIQKKPRASIQEICIWTLTELQKTKSSNAWKRALFPVFLYCAVTFVFGFVGTVALGELNDLFGATVAPIENPVFKYIAWVLIGSLSGIFYSKTEWRREFFDDTLNEVSAYQENNKDSNGETDTINAFITSKNKCMTRWIVLSAATAALLAWNTCAATTDGNWFIITSLTTGLAVAYGAIMVNREGYLQRVYDESLKTEEAKVGEEWKALKDEASKTAPPPELDIDAFLNNDPDKDPEAFIATIFNETKIDYVEKIRRFNLLDKNSLPLPTKKSSPPHLNEKGFGAYLRENILCCCKRTIKADDIEMNLLPTETKSPQNSLS